MLCFYWKSMYLARHSSHFFPGFSHKIILDILQGENVYIADKGRQFFPVLVCSFLGMEKATITYVCTHKHARVYVCTYVCMVCFALMECGCVYLTRTIHTHEHTHTDTRICISFHHRVQNLASLLTVLI